MKIEYARVHGEAYPLEERAWAHRTRHYMMQGRLGRMAVVRSGAGRDAEWLPGDLTVKAGCS